MDIFLNQMHIQFYSNNTTKSALNFTPYAVLPQNTEIVFVNTDYCDVTSSYE